eukprot:964829-Alexandrium_andersonii.AAC.1
MRREEGAEQGGRAQIGFASGVDSPGIWSVSAPGQRLRRAKASRSLPRVQWTKGGLRRRDLPTSPA